jgi:hypothetical protein
MQAVVTFEGHTGRARPTSEILNDLKRLKPADIAYGHLHNFPEVADFICRDGFIPYFILRDPRDVVVSHAFYVTEMQTQHIHHNFYQNVLEDENERLHTSIVGIASENDYGGPSLPNINDRFTPYLGWLDRPEVLTLHYENFVTQRQQTLSTILDHAVLRGFVLECARETALRILDESINPRSSPTYRSGKIGGWQSAFNEDHKRSFKNVSGDLLIRLGYEENQNW